MSNGYLLAADADLPGLGEVADGFGLIAVGANALGSHEAAAAAMQGASNVGIVLSHAATRDVSFVALLHVLAGTLRTAQLILAEPDARAAFGFLPEAWPSMALADARARAADLVRRRAGEQGGEESPRARPLPPVDEAPAPEPELHTEAELGGAGQTPSDTDPAPGTGAPPEGVSAPQPEDTPPDDDTLPNALGAGRERAEYERWLNESRSQAARNRTPEEEASSPSDPIIQQAAIDEPLSPDMWDHLGELSAAADATAFAPKKLRRGTPELVRVVIHQPKDLKDVIKAARKIDPRADAAPSGMKIGDVALGARIGVSLEVRGAACDGAIQRRTWEGEPLDFNFSAEAEADVKQAVFLARVFIDDAQIGVLAFTRPVGGPKKNAESNDRVRLKRHKRVFLSYSSKDRETVSAIATAYQAAGVQHFFDRTSLKSGEEWSPRLRQEIDRADLFHLCWSKSASDSEWVAKEAEHALTRRRRSNGKKPDITVQMLDGPPWAKHPDSLDSINFDDFVRAAIVGYARGDGES